MPERRLAPRVQVHLPVHYQSDAVAMPGLVSSLSRTGAFVRSDFLDSRQQKVSIEIRLPGDADVLRLSGRVVHVSEEANRAGMGIRFMHLDEATRRRLADFTISVSFRALE
jgi:uncharacterized protein (TIGR02266 family)